MKQTQQNPLPSSKLLLDTSPLEFNETPNYWDRVLSELTTALSANELHHFISPLKVAEINNEIILFVPNKIFFQEFSDQVLGKIKDTMLGLGLAPLINLRVELLKNERKSSLPSRAEEDPLYDERSGAENFDSENSEESYVPSFSKTLPHTKLNQYYNFSTFVRGPSNQFALATCLNVAENPGINYNPLFLYGSTGLGKTHLLHAVGNQVLQINPSAIVTYISSERFMNEMIYCIRHNKMWDFRQKYRHCDLFMMDDIQFISGNKSATQEEFFHTFNTLYEAKKQIIITSDLFPQDIPDIEERLRNRFQWGLIADIQPPDIEHRIAILMSKAEKLGVKLKEDVAEFIASQAKRNVRELEGALHRTVAFATLHGRPLDKALAAETFHSMTSETPKTLAIEVIQKVVADHFKLKISDLKSKKRQRALSIPRQIAMYLARQLTQASYPEIGDKFGGKDHTTIIHAVKKIALDKTKDMDMKANLETLQRLLEQIQ